MVVTAFGVLQRALPYSLDERGTKHDLALPDRMPAVVVFDVQGNIVKSWGRHGFVLDWPKSEHGLWVDAQSNVWIGGNAPGDRQVIKFTNDGRQLLEIGRRSNAPRNNADTTMLGEPAGIEIDSAAHEVYISDGYLNSRVVVYDLDTGKFKRGWGAYGVGLDEIANPPEPMGAAASTLGHYVREGPDYRPGDPPQCSSALRCIACICLLTGLSMSATGAMTGFEIFTKQGKFLKEFFVHRETRGQRLGLDAEFFARSRTEISPYW